MLLDSGVSLVWECCSKDVSPLLFCRPLLLRCRSFVRNCLHRDVVTSRGFVLKEPLSVDVLPAPWRLPVFLLRTLGRHPLEKISAHVVVVHIRLVAVFVCLNELICQRVYE